MKKVMRMKAALAMMAMAVAMVSCSDDEADMPRVNVRVIDFERPAITVAGPTSYGANMYSNFDGVKFTSASIEVERGVNLEFGLNSDVYSASPEMSNGGMFLSRWNYRSNPADKSGDWWYTYENQCSVYNAASTDGANEGAGVDGSNTFAIITGADATAASMQFSAGAEYEVSGMYVCPTSYLYGVAVNGNDFALSLERTRGWLKVMAYGYDAAGNPTNGGQPVEMYVCDYRNSNAPVKISDKWTMWDMSQLGRVNKVKFDFDGSDKGQWGINTPAYLCVDNIRLVLSYNY